MLNVTGEAIHLNGKTMYEREIVKMNEKSIRTGDCEELFVKNVV